LGEAVLLELLQKRGLTPTQKLDCEVSVVPLSAADRTEAIQITTRLRREGFRVDLWLQEQSLNRALKRAEQAKPRFVIVHSSVERAAGLVAVRDQATGERDRINRKDLVNWLKYRRHD
jgi:histidyl-tRNA synthetase